VLTVFVELHLTSGAIECRDDVNPRIERQEASIGGRDTVGAGVEAHGTFGVGRAKVPGILLVDAMG